jgi:hypothetical protein
MQPPESSHIFSASPDRLNVNKRTNIPVACRHCFGFSPEVYSNVHWVEDNLVVYPAGHNVVVMNVETKQQRFISGSSDSECITALAVSPNRKF